MATAPLYASSCSSNASTLHACCFCTAKYGAGRTTRGNGICTQLRPRKVTWKGEKFLSPKKLGVNIRSSWRGFFFSIFLKKKRFRRMSRNHRRCSNYRSFGSEAIIVICRASFFFQKGWQEICRIILEELKNECVQAKPCCASQCDIKSAPIAFVFFHDVPLDHKQLLLTKCFL